MCRIYTKVLFLAYLNPPLPKHIVSILSLPKDEYVEPALHFGVNTYPFLWHVEGYSPMCLSLLSADNREFMNTAPGVCKNALNEIVPHCERLAIM